MKKYLLFITICSFLMFGLLSVVSIHAQQSQGLDLTMTPTVLDLTNNPGEKVEGKFRIRNNASQPITLALRVDKLEANNDTGQVVLKAAEPGDTFLSWLTFDKNTFSALPREWTTINYTLTIPKDAAFGYYYAIKIAQIKPTEQGNTNNTKVLGEVVLPVLVNVQKPGARKEARLLSFAPKQMLNEYLPVEFITTVQNTGNVHIRPRGNIFIRSLGEKDVGILDVNPAVGAILPNSKRTFLSDWTDGFLVNSPQLTINWDKLTHFRIGKYTANVLLVYDNGTRDVTLEGSTSFWVFPYTLFAILLGGILFLILIIRFFIKLYIKRELKKYQSKISNF